MDAGDTDVTVYVWDYRNRLTEVTHYSTYANYAAGESDKIVEYAYDSFNHLIGRIIDADGSAGAGGNAETVYAYDGDQIALQFDHAGSGDATAAELSHRYFWNPQAVDQLFAEEQTHYDSQQAKIVSDAVLWALTDHENSIRDLAVYNSGTDATTVADHRIYDAYGNLTSETAAVDCVFGYTGRQTDAATGLQNNLNRWYDPSTGRWISHDPIGFSAGDANLYRYVNNGPLDSNDPSGLCAKDALTKIGGFFYGFGMELEKIGVGMYDTIKTAERGYDDLAYAIYIALNDPKIAAQVLSNGVSSTLDSVAKAYDALAEDPSLALGVATEGVKDYLEKNLSTPEGIGRASADVLVLLAPTAKGILNAEADAKIAQVAKDFVADEHGTLKIPGGEPTGDAASIRAENIAKGIPESELGPSGKPKIHVVEHPSLKSAKDAARADVGRGGTTVKHPSPEVGDAHFHGVDQGGSKSRIHHEYPN